MGLVSGYLERRFETIGPSSLAEPSRSLMEALGAMPSATGVPVSEKRAEGLPAVYGCVDVISSMEAWLPLKLMRDVPNSGGREPATDHSLYDILHHRPNPVMTAVDFRLVMGRWKLLWGTAYAEIIRNRAGDVTALWPLQTNRMEAPKTDASGRLFWRYRMEDGSTHDYVMSDPSRPPLVRLMINSLDGIVGRSPIRVLMDSMGVSLAARDFGAYVFGNKAQLGGLLKFKGALKPEQKERNRTEWNKVHSGVANAGRTAVLEGDVDYTPIGIPPNEAQFVELMAFSRVDIRGYVYRVPGFLVGDTEKSTSWGTGIEQQMRGFLTVTMMPYLTAWEQAVSRDLLSPEDAKTHHATFITNALVKPDLLQLSQSLKVQIEAGLLSPNEARALMDLSRRTDDEGDAFWRPANMSSTAEPIEETPPKPPVDDDEE